MAYKRLLLASQGHKAFCVHGVCGDTMRRAVNIIFDSFWSSALSADDNGQLRRREIDANQDLNTVKYIKLYSSFLFPYLTWKG